MSYGTSSYGTATYGHGSATTDTVVNIPLDTGVLEYVGREVTTSGGDYFIELDAGVLFYMGQDIEVVGGTNNQAEPTITCEAEIGLGDIVHNINLQISISSTSTIELADSGIVFTRAEPWWNDFWPFRRDLKITAPPTGLESGSPIEVRMDTLTIVQGKVRGDLGDIYAVQLLSTDPEQWDPLPTYAENDGENIVVRFHLTSNIPANSEVTNTYYVYYGNSGLDERPTYEEFVYDAYPVVIEFDDPGISYTRPGEDWIDGIGVERNGKATFTFWGDQIQLYCDKGPSYGIVELQLDDEESILIDLFSTAAQNNVLIYEEDSLPSGVHYLRIKTTGEKHISSSSFDINIGQIRYRKHGLAENLREESNNRLLWSSIIGGAVNG